MYLLDSPLLLQILSAMESQDVLISSWSGKPIRQPIAPESSIDQKLPLGPSSVLPTYPQAEVGPKSLQSDATLGPHAPQGSCFVVTPVCKPTAAQPAEYSCPNSSSDAASIASASTPSPSSCTRPPTASVASCRASRGRRPSYPFALRPKLLLPSQATEAEASKKISTRPCIGSISSLL